MITKSAIVIIPTIGSDTLLTSLLSITKQTYTGVTVLIGIDGKEYWEKVNAIIQQYENICKEQNLKFINIQTITLPENVGKNGFYGQRIYAAFSHLVNKDYLFFLDEDNWYKENHIESCINLIENSDIEWSFSLRHIYSKEGDYICRDDCESLGKYDTWTNTRMIDTSCYCLPRHIAIKIASCWHSGWGEDRVIFSVLNQYYPKYECTKEYTVNYRLGGNENSVKREFFEHGNKEMLKRYNGVLPWKIK